MKKMNLHKNLLDNNYLTWYHQYSLLSPIMIMRIIGNIVFVIGLILSPLLFLGIPMVLHDLIMQPETATWKLFILVILDIFLLFFGMVFANLFPDLKVDDKGLYVRFYLRWLFVPWENIISVRESFISVMFSPSKKIYFVLTKKLTPVHWLISLNQLGGCGPGFLISQSISDNHQLMRTIKKHLANRVKS